MLLSKIYCDLITLFFFNLKVMNMKHFGVQTHFTSFQSVAILRLFRLKWKQLY
jgi:hypothetical protein